MNSRQDEEEEVVKNHRSISDKAGILNKLSGDPTPHNGQQVGLEYYTYIH
jgi:hypothetical protein